MLNRLLTSEEEYMRISVCLPLPVKKPRRYFTRSFFYSSAFLILFVACSLRPFTSSAQLYKFDRSTEQELSEDRKPWETKFCQFLSNSTNDISLAIPVSLFVAGAIMDRKDLKKNALVIGESIVLSTAITYVLKNTVKRPRPFTQDSLIIKAGEGGGYSFPSGHASQAFATATSLALAYPKWYVIAPAYLWAGWVAYSRMYLGVHYPTDVLGGIIVGSGSAFLTYKINKWIMRKNQPKVVTAVLY
jgi:undecaprenyl-diphosphatase